MSPTHFPWLYDIRFTVYTGYTAKRRNYMPRTRVIPIFLQSIVRLCPQPISRVVQYGRQFTVHGTRFTAHGIYTVNAHLYATNEGHGRLLLVRRERSSKELKVPTQLHRHGGSRYVVGGAMSESTISKAASSTGLHGLLVGRRSKTQQAALACN